MASVNASPEYYVAERKYGEAKTPEDKIAALEEMLRLAPKHKASHSLLADIRHKMARIKKEQAKEEIKARQRKGGGREFVKKQGVQIALLGKANAGKTALFNALTGLREKSTPAPFETVVPKPGAWEFHKVQIQVLDLPSVTGENKPKVYAFARNADLAVIILDGGEDFQAQESFFKDVRNEKVFFASSKNGKRQGTVSYEVFNAKSVKELGERIYEALDIIRVFAKTPKEQAKMDKPIVLLKKTRTVLDAAKEIHKDFAENLKFARVWGSAKFPGQQVSGDYVLQDCDVIEFHMK
ncbi:MAG: GTPase [Candidatus Micrarchaeota archaeon]